MAEAVKKGGLRILLANDDGIDAEGLLILARVLGGKYSVTVYAPSSERSANSHALSIYTPLKYSEARVEGAEKAYAVEGTPADCVKFAVLSQADRKYYDLVVSGINRGANIGSDIMYSGTVSAAREGAYLGVRSIAVSQNDWRRGNAETGAEGDGLNLRYEVFSQYILNNIPVFLEWDLPVSTVLNINFPSQYFYAEGRHLGTKITRQGVTLYDDEYIFHEAEAHYTLRGKPVPHGLNHEDCDVEWLDKGYITITPLAMELTDYKSLAKIKGEILK